MSPRIGSPQFWSAPAPIYSLMNSHDEQQSSPPIRLVDACKLAYRIVLRDVKVSNLVRKLLGLMAYS
jgi:hypothetical protein